MDKQYFFIVGCPRSGTTAMWKLLSSSSEIVVGVERYAHKVFPPFSLEPKLFEKQRFLSLQTGDTFYQDLGAFNPYYLHCSEKFTNASYVGDKIPKLYEYFDEVFERFGTAKIIFMFRNIFDVAASYKARADDLADSTWDRESGVRAAIQDWQKAITAFKKNANRLSILPVCYESLFYKGTGLSKITKFLDIEQISLMGAYQNLIVRGEQLERMRSRDLTVEEVFEISMVSPFGGYRDIIDIWESFQ